MTEIAGWVSPKYALLKVAECVRHETGCQEYHFLVKVRCSLSKFREFVGCHVNEARSSYKSSRMGGS